MANRKGIRAVSQYRNYDGPNAQPLREMVLADGQRQVLQKELTARPWRWNDLTEWERVQALQHFDQMRGLTHDEDPVLRFSCFDSLWAQEVSGWTDDEREIVERAVENGPGRGPDYIVVDHPAVPVPWPAYPQLKAQGRRTVEMVAEKIAEKVLEDGYDPDMVIAYERENENRPVVVAALEALKAETPTEDLIEA